MKREDQNRLSLSDFYDRHDGKASDKWASYLEVYNQLFAHLRDKPVRMLEIGIQNGGSLEIWSEYFPNFKRIIGCDIGKKCSNLSYSNQDISVVVGNAVSDSTRERITDIEGEFDIIIDDGSHDSKDIIGAFAKYFPLLADGGMFIAEDLHCSYWPKFTGGLARRNSSIEFFKKLVDIANHSHWREKRNLRSYLDIRPTQAPDLTNAELLKVHTVFFADSMCCVKKSAVVGQKRLGRRIISGKTAIVYQNPFALDGTFHKEQRKKTITVSYLKRLLRR